MKQLLMAASVAALAACASIGHAGESVGRGIRWRCEGGTAFTARFTTNSAEVSAGGQTYRLPHVRSASGARYASGAVTYWEHGGQATLTGARGGPYATCRRR